MNNMDAYGFKIKRNNKVICRAGLEGNAVITCIADAIRRSGSKRQELHFNVTGLDSKTREHLRWGQETLMLGDKITIEVISSPFDAPIEICPPESEASIIEQKIKAYNRLKEELRDYL